MKGKTKHKQRKILTCFNVIVALVIVQCVSLLTLGFFSHHLSFQDFTSPAHDLEVWIWDYLFQEADQGGNINLHNDTDDDAADDDVIAQIAEHLEEGANHNINDADLFAGDALDNFFTRSHITDKPVPLVVGGSDGSGTRAFVDILAKMGVPMLVDDPKTMDIHANYMFAGRGWPPLVTVVLKEFHSTFYSASKASSLLQKSCQKELGILRSKLNIRANRLLKLVESKNKTHLVADNVLFGFKAPITMMLLPLIKECMYSRFKYLHVVRDGRDVALSSNQSPVVKFYNVTYLDADKRKQELIKANMTPVMGMQLWSDWNVGVLEWLQHQESQETQNSQPQVDYLVARSEDLLNPATRFKALVQLAHFVGSRKSLQELCCLGLQSAKDMGKSVEFSGRSRRQGGLFGSGSLQQILEEKRQFLARFAQERGKNVKELTIKERLAAIQKFREEHSDNDSNKDDDGNITREKKANAPNNHLRMSFDSGKNKSKINPIQKIFKDHEAQFGKLGALLGERLRSRLLSRLGGKVEQALENRKRHASDFVGRRRLTEAVQINGKSAGLKEFLKRLRAKRQKRQRLQSLESLSQAKKKKDFLFSRMKRPPAEGDSELASLLNSQIRDLSQSMNNSTHKMLNQRYGKWAYMLEGYPHLLDRMEHEGRVGLASFGYNPPTQFMDINQDAENFQCDATVVCPSG